MADSFLSIYIKTVPVYHPWVPALGAFEQLKDNARTGEEQEMKEQWPFFVKGLKKLFVWAACLFMVILLCNVTGYLSTTYDFVFVTTDGSWHGSDSYIERVFSLAFLGFLQLLCGIALVALIALVLFSLYQGILMLGGYHDTQRRKLVAERLRLQAEHDSRKATTE